MQLLQYLYQTFLHLDQELLPQLLNQFLNFFYFQNGLIFQIFSVFFNEKISSLYYSVILHLVFQTFHFVVLLSPVYFLQFVSENLKFLKNFDFDYFTVWKEIQQNLHLFIDLFQSLDHGFLLFSNYFQLIALIIFFKSQLFFNQKTY